MTLQNAAEKIEHGRRLEERDAVAMLSAHHLSEIGLMAEQARLNQIPEPVASYAIGGAIPVGRNGAGSGIPCEEMAATARRLEGWGATDLCLYGAPGAEPTLAEWEALLKAIHAGGSADRPVWRLSMAEANRLATQEELSLETLFGRLSDSGLTVIAGEAVGPGSEIAPARGLAAHRAAHTTGMVSTASIPSASLKPDDLINHLQAVRELQDQTGGFIGFVSGPVGRRGRGDVLTPDHSGGAPRSSFEYLRTLAVTRCFLDNVIHIQAAWEAQGAKIGEVALRFGADDLGSTGISGLQSGSSPSLLIPTSEMERLIRDSGFTPRLRNGRYAPISADRAAGRAGVWGSELRVVP